MKAFLLLITILLTNYSIAQDRVQMQLRNQELAELKAKSDITELHNKFFIYSSAIGQPGYINLRNIEIERLPDNIFRLPIPNGMELRNCLNPPFVERVQIQVNPGQDYILVSSKDMNKFLLSCSSQNLTKHAFISYKED
jgi:hypothetical protein